MNVLVLLKLFSILLSLIKELSSSVTGVSVPRWARKDNVAHLYNAVHPTKKIPPPGEGGVQEGLGGDLIARVFGVPKLDEFIRGFAEVVLVQNITREDVWGVEGVLDVHVQPMIDAEAALQVDFGEIGAESFDFDAAPGLVEKDDGVAHFFDDVVNPSLRWVRAAR